jgi:PKD repeat protein
MKTWIFTLLFFSCGLSAFATQNKKTIKLRLQSPTGNLSDATVYFDNGISPFYNSSQDAIMVFSKVPGIPQLYAYSQDNTACSILGAGDFSSTEVVRLGYMVGFGGTYNISAIEMDNFDPTSVITLEDRKLGKFIDLRENFDQVYLDSSDTGSNRFFIHVSTPAVINTVNSNCQNNGGKINVAVDSSIIWNVCQLYNSSNQLLATDSNLNSAVTFDSLQAGNYQVVFTYNQYTTTKSMQINGNFVVASIGTPVQTIYTTEDVVFNAIATNANQYQWNFGDSTIIMGVANPDQVYLTPGQYTVNLTCSNDLGCSATAQATVIVYEATAINNVSANSMNVFANKNDVTVKMNDAPAAGAKISVYNLLGQLLLAKPITQQNQVFTLAGQPTGYYLVSVENNAEIKTKKILLSE